jgi:ubiquinone/menaquinone biosynthesis C-methylase UbiE
VASATWESGPQLVYARLAEALLDVCEVELEDRRVLDLGSGSGAVSAIVGRRRGRPVGLDGSLGMARATRGAGTPAVQADAGRLPFAAASFDVVVAAFLINHVADPVSCLAEAGRVLAPGGVLSASTFAAGPEHPVKAVVDEVAADMGWQVPEWYEHLKSERIERVADAAVVAGMARDAGFATVEATVRTVDVGPFDAATLVGYRLGMGSLAGFANDLEPPERARLVAAACDRLGDPPPPLRPAVLILRAVAPAGPPPPG